MLTPEAARNQAIKAITSRLDREAVDELELDFMAHDLEAIINDFVYNQVDEYLKEKFA
ncbi:TPA: hypothetical protein NJV68_001861 [Corynebacterium striatum]|uniref:hypothetical protein n=1 Tax=Corynebacterium striatum TaxID=43770 RepID=UPI001A254215|nr:hypothetical protein [Corynebacterium striatum]HAT6525863.1 hypothetical protein [Corynebacterium striatum]HAT6563995.1 hypothetical protein [Corynebacterium striatum]HAT6569347.1 hypothetical protein [Corynebacterium striatum]HCG2976574.1 hypothetical protein [Corynebacterium striatum]